jgi:hypothetical protein
MCAAFLGAWQYKIGDRINQSEFVRSVLPAKSVSESDVATVGHITKMRDCKWADAPLAEITVPARRRDVSVTAPISVGREFILDSGQMELTFSSGARVILQGPVSFQVESNGGLLSVGVLTGKYEQSHKTRPNSPTAAPFVIRTPTATVTDLGTEFGVEVAKDGRTSSYVFSGAVKLHALAAADKQSDVILKQNEGAHVEPTGSLRSVIRRGEVDARRFVRPTSRSGRLPIAVFATGVGASAADPDAYWQVVAASNDPAFPPQPAIVVRSRRTDWAPASASVAKWISWCADSTLVVPPGVTYTFETTFDIDRGLLDTAVLSGAILCDHCIRAIRLNGQNMPLPDASLVPKYQWESVNQVQRFSIDRGFVRGKNVLDIEVETGYLSSSGTVSSLGLRAELEGSIQEEP